MPVTAKSRSKASQTRKHINAVLAQSQARHSRRLVLMVLARRADFETGLVRITKENILGETGYNLKTIKEALAWLRREGSIVEIGQSLVGGRGKVVTYGFRMVGQGGSLSEGSAATVQGEDAAEGRDTALGEWEQRRGVKLRYLIQKHGLSEALEIIDRWDAANPPP